MVGNMDFAMKKSDYDKMMADKENAEKRKSRMAEIKKARESQTKAKRSSIVQSARPKSVGLTAQKKNVGSQASRQSSKERQQTNIENTPQEHSIQQHKLAVR